MNSNTIENSEKANMGEVSSESSNVESDKLKSDPTASKRAKFRNSGKQMENYTCQTTGDINPFTHEIPWRYPYDYVKVAILAVVLAPLRLLLGGTCLVLSWAMCHIAWWRLSLEQFMDEPATGWRGFLRHAAIKLFRGALFFMGSHWVVVKGEPPASKAEAPILVIAPHSSYLDSIFTAVLGCPSMVSSKHIYYAPFIGTIISVAQPIYVSRDCTLSRQKTIQEINRRANPQTSWQKVSIYPEGTCTNGKALISFKLGAFNPGLPVQPVVLRYPNVQNSVIWTWFGDSFLWSFMVSLSQFHNYCEMEYLKVYTPSEEELKDPSLYANNVRTVMAKALELPCVDYSVDDCRLMQAAQKLGLPPQTGLIQAQNFKLQFKIRADDLRACLTKHWFRLCNKEGRLKLSELSNKMGIFSDQPLLLALFYAIGKGKDIAEFKDYAQFFFQSLKDASAKEIKLKDLFKCFLSSYQTEENEIKYEEDFEIMTNEKKGEISVKWFSNYLQQIFNMEKEMLREFLGEKHDKEFLNFDDFNEMAENIPELIWLLQKHVTTERDI